MATTKWVIDPTHSEIHFKVRHLVISNVTGSFKKFEGSAVSETGSLEDAKIEASIDVKSIDTNEPGRDEHLRTADFFSADLYPEIKFESTSFKKIKEDQYKLSGNLSMRGVTKPVELDAEFGGTQTDPYGNKKSGFEVTGSFDRKDFGITFNALTETGSIVVGDTIKLTANIQLVEQQTA